ncbi:MAG: T9SS type A sorting domain-containing protein [Bacteroidetes bacterium]|nr:T9SS type A sorting domain-containing protein [Bacteroidota bacterium]
MSEIPVYCATVTWDGGGDGSTYSDANNWSGNAVPGSTDDITIDCSCTVDHNADLVINGSLTIASGTTFDGGGFELKFGESDNTATGTNNGIITNVAELKISGSGTYAQGPFFTNNGTVTAGKVKVGNNNGGGMLTNASGSTINVTNTVNTGPDGIDESLHVDGELNNGGTINVTLGASFHGGILSGGGTLNVASLEFEAGKGAGGATGGASDIQNQSFSDGASCSSADAPALVYHVIGGTGGGPNGDDTYTYQELLDEFGLTDGTEFVVHKNYVSSCSVTPLPISLVSFDTKVYTNSTIEIEWTTATETNNDFFTIERSLDGRLWEQVSIINGAGNSYDYLDYKLIDENPFLAVSYYRLKQTDFDGQFSYSWIESVDLSISEGNKTRIFPNPFFNYLTVEGNLLDNNTFCILNSLGQDVSMELEIIYRTTSLIYIDTSNLQLGMYVIRTKSENLKVIKK